MNTEILGVVAQIVLMIVLSYPLGKYMARVYKGEKGGDQAKPLLMAGLVGGLYDFIVGTFGWWNE